MSESIAPAGHMVLQYSLPLNILSAITAVKNEIENTAPVKEGLNSIECTENIFFFIRNDAIILFSSIAGYEAP